MVRSLLTLRSDDLYPLPWDFGIVGTRTCFQSGDQRSDSGINQGTAAGGRAWTFSLKRSLSSNPIQFPQFRTLVS